VTTQFVLSFDRSYDLFDTGYLKDLGTGLTHKQEIPCEVVNIPPAPGFDSCTCLLSLGTYPNPT